MKTIRLYRHPDCAKCTAYTRWHHRLDWLDHFEDSTAASPLGPMRMGQIAVQDLASGTTDLGIEGFRRLCRAIPAYWLVLPLTYLPAVSRRIEAEIGGCADGRCDLPGTRGA